MKIIERMTGCLVGGAIGDAIGGRHEGRGASCDVSWDPPWRISDDTQLTMATCESIIQEGKPTTDGISAAFLRWYRERRLTGLGAATLGALKGLEHGGHWALVGRRGEMAAGNGAAMRVAPLGFTVDPTSEQGRVLIRDVSYITHHSDEAYSGALAVVLAIYFIRHQQWKGSGGLISMICDYLPDTLVRERLLVVDKQLPAVTVSQIGETYGCSGYVVESVPLALAAAQDVKATGFRKMIEAIVQCGGDADTNASIAGQVAGCLLGLDGLRGEPILDWPVVRRLDKVASDFLPFVTS